MTDLRCRLSAARATVCAIGCGIVVLAALPIDARAATVPNPTVFGPIASPDIPDASTHNYPFFATKHDLPTHGFVEPEFYFQGAANRYNTSQLATGSIIDSGHPYLTRMLVRQPADTKQFNGTVLVEWLNVTNGLKNGRAIGYNCVVFANLDGWGAVDDVGRKVQQDALFYEFSFANDMCRKSTFCERLIGLSNSTG